jgi:hypothetical protein
MELKVKGKFVFTSKVKIFQNPSCPILEKINEIKDLWGTKVMHCYVVKSPVFHHHFFRKIRNFLKNENFSKSFLTHMGKNK